MLNVEKSRADKIYNNDKLQPVILAVGAGIGSDFDITKIRYGKVIIMADADVDGAHIRTLLLTFFFRYMRPLIENGNVYLAQPPLYKLSKKGMEDIYCYTDDDLAKAFEKIAEKGISRDQVERGQVLAKPGSVTPHHKFKGSVYVLSKEEGGRHTPFFSNYRPQFYFRTTDVTGVITLPEGVEMVMPGDNVDMTVELIAPVALENGTKFSIREGGRTVGAGVISEIIK